LGVRVITCPFCAKKYSLDEARVPPQGAQITCPLCSGKFDIDAEIPDSGRGERARCPSCEHVLTIPLVRLLKIPDDGADIDCPACGESFRYPPLLWRDVMP
jgi:uncharacterized Zn-finger protein